MSATLRPLGLDESPSLDGPQTHALERFVAARGRRPDLAPEAFLLWEQDGALLGWARLDPIRPGLYGLLDAVPVTPPQGDPADRQEAVHALIGAVRDYLEAQELEAATWIRHSDPLLHQAILSPFPRGRFELYVEKLYVRRSLEGYVNPWPDPFALHGLAEVGEPAFARALGEAISGSPNRDLTQGDPVRELEEMRAMEGASHDPTAWVLATVGDEPAGVILANRFPGEPAEGTFTFLGLLPRWRQRGLGVALHGRGLALLAARGIPRYLCSTDVQNAAMIRTYRRNNCEPFDVRRQYRWTWSA